MLESDVPAVWSQSMRRTGGAGLTPWPTNVIMTPLPSVGLPACELWPLSHGSPERPGEHCAVILGVTHAIGVLSCYPSSRQRSFCKTDNRAGKVWIKSKL